MFRFRAPLLVKGAAGVARDNDTPRQDDIGARVPNIPEVRHVPHSPSGPLLAVGAQPNGGGRLNRMQQ